MQSTKSSKMTLRRLWAEFIPLSLSDVMMALGDPLVTTTLAHLPEPRANLAAVGIAKPVAVFFESPIIMVLHASNALGGSGAARRALKRFVMLSISVLSAVLFCLSLPPVFRIFGGRFLGVPEDLMLPTRMALFLMFLWPAASGWRRYYQGLLIRHGYRSDIARASIGRFFCGIAILGLGFVFGMNGYLLGALGLIGKIVFEAVMITLLAKGRGESLYREVTSRKPSPRTVGGIWRFYWPLANSMIVVWGGRALLVALIARATDAEISLAAWPAAWGLVLLIANSTRMVQQVILRHHDTEPKGLLLRFAFSVGAVCSLLLALACVPPWGRLFVETFIGKDQALASLVCPVLFLCVPVPLLVALQNAAQGFLIGENRTSRVNVAAWMGTAVLLAGACLGVWLGQSGALIAATAMPLSLSVELCCLWGLTRLVPSPGLVEGKVPVVF